MDSFGAYLKSLREERGISLEEISQRTRIAVSNLDFLEKERFELLPPRAFVKGFIRSYVQELGLNPEEALKRFEAFTREGELTDYTADEGSLFQEQSGRRSFTGRALFTIALSAVGVIALAILLVTGISRLLYWDDKSGTALPTVTTVGPSGYSETPGKRQGVEKADQTAFTEPPRKQAGRKILEIKALAHTWIRVQPDMSPPEEMTMAPGDIQIFTAKNSFSLQTGNAGGIRLRYDGRELPAMGKENQTLSLTLP